MDNLTCEVFTKAYNEQIQLLNGASCASIFNIPLITTQELSKHYKKTGSYLLNYRAYVDDYGVGRLEFTNGFRKK
jgi:hypothetical protein